MIWKWNIRGRKIGFSYFKEGRNDVYGYTNRCDDGKFIIFLDYDELPLEWIKKEIRYLQEDFNLGNFYIIKSSINSFHAICFTKVTRKELVDIILNSSVDENYYRIPFTIGKRLLTLRLTEKNNRKPKFELVLANRCDRLESYEHKKFFHKWFNIMCDDYVEKNNDLDHSSIIQFSNYKVK